MGNTSYAAEVRHDDRLHAFTVSDLELPICRACGEKVFTEEACLQVSAALRSHLNLLTPEQIRTAIDRVGMSQPEVAERLGIAEETLARWLDEMQIQSRAMDNLLRTFFAFPTVRIALSGPTQDSQLGISDMVGEIRGGGEPASSK
jgi:DNA-binding transcriptional regulator YiaG